jgi:cytidylate kinase
MALIIISSTSAALRQEVSESLAGKLGYACLSREKLVEQATAAGIAVGKLEMSIIKRPAQSERQARLKERYLAFISSGLCEQAGGGNLVYHSRGGHLLLPNVSHIFRIHLVPNQEQEIHAKMQQLRLDHPKAEKYIEQVNEDIEKWVRLIHGQDIHDPKQYDLILNLENMSLANASAALCSMAELPDFRPTPASLKAMGDYCLAARARLKLALDERTAESDFTLSANDGVVTVTYMPRQSQGSQFITEVLADLPGVKEVLATMADSNVLWIQERFDPRSENFSQINQVAQRWGAAIELLRFIPSEEIGREPAEEAPADPATGLQKKEYTGGIEDDLPETPSVDDGGLGQTQEELVRQGRSGGSRSLQGNFQTMASAVSRNVNYSLVVIGDLFLSKSKAVQTRMLRDAKVFLGDRVRVPVISVDELQEKYLFGGRQLIKFLIFIALVAGIYLTIFTNQVPILGFLQEYKGTKVLSAVVVALFVPIFAYLYGTVAHLFLKMIKFD